MIDWNNMYPIDKWWRDKHNVAFGSKAHRDQNLLDMRLEFEEDLLFAEAEREAVEKARKKASYNPGTGDWLSKTKKTKVETQTEIEKDFNRLDVNDLADAKTEIVNGKKRITF